MDSPNDRSVRRGALVITLTLLLIVATTATAIVFPSGREWVRQRMRWAPPGYSMGAASGLLPALYDGADFTVLIFATTNCVACQRALPFHQELARADDGARVRTRILMTSPGDDIAAYAMAAGVNADRVLRFDAQGSKVRRVPTILVIDRAGLVREMKEGVLPDDEQHALLEKIRNLR